MQQILSFCLFCLVICCWNCELRRVAASSAKDCSHHVQCLVGDMNTTTCECDSEKPFFAIGIVVLALIASKILYMCVVNKNEIIAELSQNQFVRRKHIKSYGSQDNTEDQLSEDHAQLPLMRDYKSPQSIHRYCGSCGTHMSSGGNLHCTRCGVDLESSYVLVS